MILLFARHGNTFEAHEAPRIVGAHEDMPLTKTGEEQARALGRALAEAHVTLATLWAGPLSRTRVFAEIIAEEIGFKKDIRIDARLRELDFGAWSGLTDDEVADQFGAAALEGWRKHGLRPAQTPWTPDEQSLRADLNALSTDMAKLTPRGEASLCVTSNGILRYAMELDFAAHQQQGANGGFRVKTGRLCAFQVTEAGPQLAFWDQLPSAARIKSLFS